MTWFRALTDMVMHSDGLDAVQTAAKWACTAALCVISASLRLALSGDIHLIRCSSRAAARP